MTEESTRTFRLRVEPQAGEAVRLTLWQQRPPARSGSAGTAGPSPAANGRGPGYRRLATLEGTPLVVALDQVLELLRREGYRGLRGGERLRAGAGRAADNGAHELPLGETTGVRLGLLFLALRPLRRVERMERVAAGVRSMTDEEAYYWFSKCLAAGTGRRARRALRLLLAGE
ncbi:hypothetical protein NET02_02510 [Thermomicrobiaceae bacterium CFH 74404]|uniref:DUF7680 domain-containing protein n=1 Tax=Thermalbibacter longus TaxID=2951981 RepID=A0AA41WBR9_9BACT|nr:hypothetical protein [Thermalbibacter longus]MCM8748013.1 hypothetical protein [Thermalbibacter longus]